MNSANPISDELNEEKAYRVAFLIAGYISKSLSTAEQEELDDWLVQSEENMQLFARLIKKKSD